MLFVNVIVPISEAMSAAQTVKHKKFNSSKLARQVIVNTTATINTVRTTQSELIAQGILLAGIRPLEIALVKDEAVSRSIAALVFSPDQPSTVASLKKVRREVNSHHGNGCQRTIRELTAWKYNSPFLSYAKEYILAYDVDYDSADDLEGKCS